MRLPAGVARQELTLAPKFSALRSIRSPDELGGKHVDRANFHPSNIEHLYAQSSWLAREKTRRAIVRRTSHVGFTPRGLPNASCGVPCGPASGEAPTCKAGCGPTSKLYAWAQPDQISRLKIDAENRNHRCPKMLLASFLFPEATCPLGNFGAIETAPLSRRSERHF